LVNLKDITDNIDSKKIFMNKVPYNSKALFKKNKCYRRHLNRNMYELVKNEYEFDSKENVNGGALNRSFASQKSLNSVNSGHGSESSLTY